VEVTFDIDANGIVHVSAKDKGTNKEQSMTITGGSSLPKEDIERMVQEAEEHAAEDKKRREAAEERNGAEQLAYSVEKLLKDNDEKLPDDVKSEVQADLDALKTALAGEDDEAVKTAMETLSQSQTKLGEALYKEDAEAPADAGDAPAEDDEDIVDAEVVDDEAGRQFRQEVDTMPKSDKPEREEEEQEQPLFTDKRRVDPETGDVRPEAAEAASGDDITEEDIELLAEAERDLVAEYRDRAARAEAELQNFRMRVERDRQANREAVIAEVIRALLARNG
jgi:molecular chaperone GrpE (heat shock protein)